MFQVSSDSISTVEVCNKISGTNRARMETCAKSPEKTTEQSLKG